MSYLPIPTSLDTQQVANAIVGQMQESEIVFEDITQFSVPTEKEVTSSASILLAVGSSNATGRRMLVVKNVGEGVFLLSGTNAGGGKRIMPKQTVKFTFASTDSGYADVSLYARAETRSTTVEIMEA